MLSGSLKPTLIEAAVPFWPLCFVAVLDPAEVGPTEEGTAEVGTAQASTVKVCTGEAGIAEVGIAEVSPAELERSAQGITERPCLVGRRAAIEAPPGWGGSW